ncbi:tetratricopeptide repeat protein [Neorhodopirellula pilleata]|uniref:Tetratricopeptide repeat protein n=1 Tax=Neorhodopirellula pilleata TaxID=2714738 RepID=A0A5C6AIL8_9BACT|nr:tetratricopeptide repeat protein [Neorhodopirellula pilleata]TWT99015.1 tetratricopeptide repeat protein [Neorhodopirellula pilleata]
MVAKRFLEILVALALVMPVVVVTGQEPGDSAAADREAQIAERFMQVLLRRPAQGTALDRVYGYHVQAGTLDAMLENLKTDVDAGTDNAGAKAMLLGLLQLQRGTDAEAAESLGRAEKLRPDDAMASYHFGKALLLVGRGEAAAEAFERAIDRKPARNEALPVFTELGRLYGRSQQTDKALAVWNRLEQTFPGDTRVGEQIAQTLAEEGQNEEALKRYLELAKKTSASGDARGIGYQVAAAELKRRIGKSDEALADFEAILSRLRPSSWLHSDVRRRIEAGFLRSGDYAALADYYAGQLAKQPDAMELRMRLGQVQSKAGLLADAEKTLVETVELAPTETEPRLALIDLYQATAKTAEAAEQLRVLVEQDPENPDYLIRLGNTILEDTTQDKPARQNEAAAVWQQLADARKDDAVITAQVGDLMRRIERVDDAIAMYNRAIELAPDQPQYREYLGEYLHRLGRQDEAMTTWNSIAEGKRGTRDNYIRLAEVLNTFDHPDKALDAFAQAIELDPTFSHRLRYTELLTRAEQYDEAMLQLDASEVAAETPEEREQLLRSRIGVYASSGTLEERTAEASKTAEASGSAQDYRRLALMLDASARTDDAVAAIESAMKADRADITAMEVAAELYRKSSRSADAITIYRRLAEVDPRFLPNYLKRIASLHMELGQVELALSAAEELIQAGPGNPESYRFYAEQCFRVGRDDEGIEKLRRALRAAPRDRDARRALASALDDRFRTDEAIELYWALLEDNDDLSEQRGLIKSLASLYGRKGDFDRLLSRLELRGRESSDMRTATLLISEAHRSMDDLGAARMTLEPLLAENPRDAELIAQLVDLSEAADDLETALQYQAQLTKLADTPENRNRELKLLINSGQMDRAEATLQRMQAITDPLAMIDIIDRSLIRKESESVVRFCKLALEKDPGLWEVRPRLIAGFIESQRYDEALEEIERVIDLDLPGDVLSEKRKDMIEKAKARARSSSTSSNAIYPNRESDDGSRWIGYVGGMSSLARYHKLGQYARMNFSSSQTSGIDPEDVLHAKLFAETYRMIIASKQGKLDEFATIEGLNDEDKVSVTDDIEWLKRFYLFASFRPSLESRSTSQLEPNLETATWKLIEQVPSFRPSMLYRVLSSRASLRARQTRSGASKVNIEPLSDERIELIANVVAGFNEKDLTGNTVQGYTASHFYNELKESGREEIAASVRDSFPMSTDTLQDAMASVSIAARFQDTGKAAELLDGVIKKLPGWAPTISANDAYAMSRASAQFANIAEIDEATQLSIADLTIALQAIVNQNTRRSRRSTSSSLGLVNTYSNRNGSYQQLKLQVPLASDRLPSNLVTALAQSGFANPGSDLFEKARRNWKDGDLVLAGQSSLAATERELRDVLVAYSHWWDGEITKTYDAIIQLSEADPEDNDWWIERARLAAELKMPEASLEALDSIHPTDQSTLQIRELAAMNLASQLGNLDRAKTAAQRLFGMRLDVQTELALADQLTRLGMREMSAAVLQRSRRRGGQSVSDLLSLADRYVTNGDTDAAAEIAYSAMRKLSRGGDSNEDYYRRRAVEMLRRGGRLDAIIEMAEKRVASSSTSLSLKSELAQLYTAAGRKDDAEKVFGEIAKLEPNDPKTLWETAKRLQSARKYDEAAVKFAIAAVKEPGLLNNGYYVMTNCIGQCKDREPAYKELMGLNLQSVQGYMLSQLVDVNRGRSGDQTPGPFEKSFLAKVLKECSVEDLESVLRTVIRDAAIMKSEAVVDTVRRVLTSDETFDPRSQVWQRGSYGSDGRFYGIIDPCLQVLGNHDQLRAEIQAALLQRIEMPKAKDSEAGSPIAEMMLVATRIGDEPEAKYRPTLDRMMEMGHDQIPYQMWWQIGQVLEKQTELTQITVEVYEKGIAASEGNNTMRQFQYSMHPRLADAYVAAGMKDKAREKLLEMYANTDHSQDNQYNPGYGDYQDLEAFKSIASKLVRSGSRVSAIPIYAEALSKPERFQAAKNWGGGDRYQAIFEKELAATLKKLDENDFAEYLSLPPIEQKTEPAAKQPKPSSKPVASFFSTPGSTTNSTKKREFETGFALWPMPLTTDLEPSQSSVAAIVAGKLAESEPGREMMAEFDEKLAQRLNETPEDPSLVGMRALIAIATEQDTAPEHFDRLCEIVPKVEPQGKTAIPSPNILALVSPALVGLACNDAQTKTAAGRLADRLIALANASERKGIAEALTLGKIRYSESDADSDEGKQAILRALLDRAAPATTPPKVLGAEAAEDCVRVAETAVAAEAWSVAIDAIGRAFGGGPPLRTIGGDDASGTFMLQTRNRSSNREPNTNELDAIIRRVHGVLETMTPALEEDHGLAESAYEMLISVVMPIERDKEVFPYLRDLMRPTQNTPFAIAEKEKASNFAGHAQTLVVAAKAAGKLDELMSRLSERRETVLSKPLIDFISFETAAAQDDEALLSKAIDDLFASCGIVEASAQGKTSPADAATPSPTTEMSAQASLDNQTIANVLLHVAYRLEEREGKTPQVQSIWRHLLHLAGKDNAISQAMAHWRRIIDQTVRNADLNDDQVREWIELYLGSVRQFYSRYNQSGLAEQQTAYAASNLARSAIAGSRFLIAAELSRPRIIESHRQSDSNNNAFSTLEIAGADAKTRFEYLSYLLFGDSNQEVAGEGLIPMVGYSVYAEPPEVLAEAAPSLSQARNLVIAADDVPLESIGLALAVTAAECGQTDELITRLTKYVVTPGDEADAMIGLALLADGRNDAAGEVLQRMSKRLKDTLPKETVDSPLPYESTIFLVRAYDVDSMRDAVKTAYNHLIVHARKRRLGNRAGYYNKALTRITDSFAATSATDTRLDHWVAYQTPLPYTSVTQHNMPKWAVDDGSLLYGGGLDVNLMMFKYPLVGDFSFQVVQRPQIRGAFSVTSNGIAYMTQTFTKLAFARGLVGRGQVQRDIAETEKNKPVKMELIHRGDEITFRADDEDLFVDERSQAFPFVGLYMQSGSTSEASDFVISGSPTIPRQVDLLHPRLRGWSSHILSAALPPLHLPLTSDQNAKSLTKERLEQAEQAAKSLRWLVVEDELRNRILDEGYNQAATSHVHYQRPLLDGESFAYEFWYDPEKMEVHPTMGRVAMMVRPSGIQLRWLPQSSSFETRIRPEVSAESTKQERDFDPDEILVDGNLTLRPGDWNTVRITVQGEQVVITVNEQPAARVTMALDRRPGLLCEKERQCRVRKLTLSGDWPETLPDNLLSQPK